MSISYVNACSQRVFNSTCFVCLNVLENPTSGNVYDTGWNIIGLPTCKHLIHQNCFNHWTSHSRALARRDIRINDQATCPLCKVEVKENEALDDVRIISYSSEDSPYLDPQFPLPLSETPDPDNHCDRQSLQALFDKAVSAEHSDYYFNVSNFPALHQMKNRYGITLSTEQLNTILNGSLQTAINRGKYDRLDSSSLSKIKMAMLLRSDDEASKEIINSFLNRVLSATGICQGVTIDFLLTQEISDKAVLQEAFEYYIKNNFFHDAEKMHKKHDLRIGNKFLKESLMQVQLDWQCHFLSTIANSSQDFQFTVLEALKELNKSQVDSETYIGHIKYSINILLSINTLEPSEVNKSLALAVSAKDREWQQMLQTEYGAVFEHQLLKRQLEDDEDYGLSLLSANDPVSAAALIEALANKVAANPDHYSHSDIEQLLTECQQAHTFNQELVNKALTLAIYSNNYKWAETLKNKFQAILEPQKLEDCLWQQLTKSSPTMSSISAVNLAQDVKRILLFANHENEQGSKAISSVLNRLQNDEQLFNIPEIQKRAHLLQTFNYARTSYPNPKRKKIA